MSVTLPETIQLAPCLTPGAARIRQLLLERAEPDYQTRQQGYFTHHQGLYGKDDEFIGLRLPVMRQLVKLHRNTELADILSLLMSNIHECRQFALLLLVDRFKHASEQDKALLVSAYLSHRLCINNWDLVDCSAPYILGPYLQEHANRKAWLELLLGADNLWERRIAILAHWWFIRHGDWHSIYPVASRLLADKEDLIHKALGWMLREAGKHDLSVLTAFIEQHHGKMARVMLRYAIEKHPEAERKRLLAL